MIALVILFVVSFLALLVLISGKIWEQKNEQPFFTTRYLSKYDSRVLLNLNHLNKTAKETQHNISFFVTHDLPYKFIKLFSAFKNKFDERYDQLAHKIRGRYIIRKRDRVSSFIKDITDHKNNTTRETRE